MSRLSLDVGSQDIWSWAVAAYGGKGVADICLSLQDEDGQNVPLLLWAVWMAIKGHSLDDSLADRAAGTAHIWSKSVIVPLREVRRRMKSELSADDEGLRLALRQKIKALELEAERALLVQLDALHTSKIFSKIDKNQMVEGRALCNLQMVACYWRDAMPKMDFLRLTEALSEGQFLRYNEPPEHK